MEEIPLGGISDEELTRLALEADPTPDPAAVPDSTMMAQGDLPSFYLPPAMAGPQKRWRRPMAITLITAFVVIEALGFCTTYGSLVLG